MNYAQTLNWLFSQLPMYQQEGKSAYKSDIGNIVDASLHLGNPHLKLKTIHIAGTNGKGSCSHMLASIFQEAGYKTGLYTSPHLKDFRERIRINREIISKEKVIDFVKNNKDYFIKLQASFFEMTVALAFDHFANEEVDIAIIEVGLGGRLDSTNIIQPEVSIITNISLDHTYLLGDTLEKIAIEKAGIIKNKTPVVIGRKQKKIISTFKKIAKNKNTQIHWSEKTNYTSDLKGAGQNENINTVVSTIKQMRQKGWQIEDAHLTKGLQKVIINTQLQGRWQELGKSPKIICDIAHNQEGISFVMEQLQTEKKDRLHMVIGLVSDKEVLEILNELPKNATYYFCKANIPRSLDEKELKKIAEPMGLIGKAYPSVKKALFMAKKSALEKDLIFVGGSTFVVAEIL